MNKTVAKILNKQLYTVDVWDAHHPNSLTSTYVDLKPVKDFIENQKKLLILNKRYYNARLLKQYYSNVLDTHPVENLAKYTKLCSKYKKQIKELEGIMYGNC